MPDYNDLLRRIEQLEAKVASLEHALGLIDTTVSSFGDYKNRTIEELKLIEDQLDAMIDTLDLLINDQANQADRERAKALKARLKQNKTRAKNAAAKKR